MRRPRISMIVGSAALIVVGAASGAEGVRRLIQAHSDLIVVDADVASVKSVMTSMTVSRGNQKQIEKRDVTFHYTLNGEARTSVKRIGEFRQENEFPVGTNAQLFIDPKSREVMYSKPTAAFGWALIGVGGFFLLFGTLMGILGLQWPGQGRAPGLKIR